MATQPARQFLLCMVMGRDAIELWHFSRYGPHKRTGKVALGWALDNLGWQVRDDSFVTF